MAKAKHVKLGEKASVFFDPTSGLKVTPGQAVELSVEAKSSRRVIKAIKSGHLDYVHSDEMDELTEVTVKDQTPRTSADTNKKKAEAAKKAKAKKAEAEAEEDDDEGDDEWTDKKLMKLKKPELVTMAKENESELTDDELGELTKEELTEEILGLLEEDE